MKNKVFTLGFGVALLLDLFSLALFAIVVYGSIYFEGYQSQSQFLALVMIAGAIINIRNVFLDCTRTDKERPLLRGMVYGLNGPLGWQIYYSENYQKAKDGYFEPNNPSTAASAPYPVNKFIAWVIIIGVILYVSFLCYVSFLRDRMQGDYMNSLMAAVLILAVIIYMIFASISSKKNKKNPLDKDAGKWASFLVLVFFIAAMAFIFYYAKYISK